GLDRDHHRLPVGAARDGWLLALDAHHQRHRGAIDVGVEQADMRTLLRQRDGQVHRDGRFAHATLAGGYRDHMTHAGDRRFVHHPAARAHDRAELDRHILGRHAGDLLEGLLALALDLVLQRAGRRRQLDHKADMAPVDLQIFDHAARYQVAAQLRLAHGAERPHDQLFAQAVAAPTRKEAHNIYSGTRQTAYRSRITAAYDPFHLA